MVIAQEQADSFHSQVNILPGYDACHIWNGRHYKNGGTSFSFKIGKKWKERRAEIFSWMLNHNGEEPNRIVLQKCGNHSCVNPAHLYLSEKFTNNKYRPFEVRFQEHVIVNENGCSGWSGATQNGYGVICYEGEKVQATAAAWFIYYGVWPKYPQCVLHTCDTPMCTIKPHLFLGTKLDNARDCLKKGRNGKAKLTPEEVKVIYDSPLSTKELMAKFKMSKSVIRGIKTKKNWACVLDETNNG